MKWGGHRIMSDQKRKCVAYGLGNVYESERDKIYEMYNIVAVCDRNPDRKEKYTDEWIDQENLKSNIDEYDYVLVIPHDHVSVLFDLMYKLGIPEEKIKIYDFEKEAENKVPVSFYGQYNDDGIILLLFKMLNMELKNCKYVEIGTNDPLVINSTYLLYKMGARGVLIDPISVVGVLADKLRPEDEFINAAVSDESKSEISFFIFNGSALSSLHKDNASVYNHCRNELTAEINVRQIGINELLHDIYEKFDVDLLLIDAEKEDDKILRSINYEKYRPAIIVAEITNENNLKRWQKFMLQKGYINICNISNANAVFIRREAYDLRLCKYFE